jgi:sulfite exporter TauE/SafE
MDIAGGVRLSRFLLAIGAVLAAVGLGVTFLVSKIPGVLLMIAGVALLVISFSFSTFFRMLDLHTAVMRGKKKGPEDP